MTADKGHSSFCGPTFDREQNVLSEMTNDIWPLIKVTFHLEVRPFTLFVVHSVNKLWDISPFLITIFEVEWLLTAVKTRSSLRRVSFVCEQRSFLLTPNNLFRVKKVVPHFAEWRVRTNKGRSAQCGVGNSAKTGRSASWGRGVSPIKSRSSAWKVGFVSAQKSFRVITNGNFTRKIIVPLTVRQPFRIAIGRSAKGRPYNAAAKWAFGSERSRKIDKTTEA